MIFLRRLIIKVAQSYKGKSYEIDPQVTFFILIKFILNRFINLYRSFFKGLVFSLNPKKLVFLGSDTKFYNKNIKRL